MNFPSLRSDQRFVVGLVSGGHFLSHFYLLAFPPLFTLLDDSFGLSNTELGLIVSTMMLPVMLLQIPLGRVVDRVGAKRVFVAGVALTGTSTLLAGVAPNYPGLLAFALLAGVGQSAFHPSDYALLSAVVGENNEGKGFSVHTFGGFAGFAGAPVVVGGLGVSLGWRPALLAVGVVGLLYAGFAALTLDTVYLDHLDETADETDSQGFLDDLRTLFSSELGLIFVFFMLLFMAGTGIQSFTTVFLVSAYDFSETVGNSALTVYFALSAVGILVGGVLADRLDFYRIVTAALAGAAVAMAVLALRLLPVTAIATFAGFATVGFLTGVIRPSRDRLVSAHAPEGSSGQSFGFVFSGGSLGGFVSPLLLGFVIDTMTVALAVGLIAAFFLACALLVAALRVRDGIETSRLVRG